MTQTYRKKLIEVALPLEAINKESAREKSIRHGHPSTLHLWWARRPLAACRAVLFSSLIDDPDQAGVPEELLQAIDRLPMPEMPGEEWQRLSRGEQRRQRLFAFIERLVKWENSNDEAILSTARGLIMAATGGNPPPVLDPFCGGGSIPLEAQRLGLEAHASDLNPVAVLITKALIEIPPRFANRPPVNPVDRNKGMGATWKGAAGLAADIRYYGQWMRDEAWKRIGYLYPKVRLPSPAGRGNGGEGAEATVIAWLWARTVKCPNPACGAQMPLVRSFWLSTKKGKQAWVEPIVDHGAKTVRFEVRTGEGLPIDPPKTGRGAKFKCLVCGEQAPDQHLKDEGTAGRMGSQLMAIVAEGSTGRTYTAPTPEQQAALGSAKPAWAPEEELAYEPRAIWCTLYGLKKFRDLFTPRQLVALTTFSDLVGEARQQVLADAGRAGDPEAQAYADAVATYLALGVSRSANSICSLAIWSQSRDQSVNVFSRQALPMTWDFPEVNPFAGAAGDFAETMLSMSKTVAGVPHQSRATVSKVDASTFSKPSALVMIATDPPYYDNIGYADLSDFFYVWLRHSLVNIYQDLFSTLLAPKAQEIVASPYRFGGDKDKARRFFETGLGQAFSRMREAQNPDYPLTVYYAFKQAEDSDKGNEPNGGLASTGWETMLEGLLKSGFAITGTWPMRSERPTGVKSEVNALASSIVLVCRPRPASAPIATRRDFGRALQAELPAALRNLQRGNIAPVDFAQAAIGPGMAVFSRYAKVIEADGSAMPVRTALALINQALDQVLAEQEGEFDADTRWTVAWFEQHGMQEGPYGDAETLSKAKDTSVQGLANDGLLESRGGKVRLRRRDELPADWDPRTDNRLTVWEVTQHLVRRLEQGEEAAAQLLLQVGGMGETARDLAYRLYSICERKKWAQEALAYNSLVIAWPELTARAAQLPAEMVQGRTGM